MNLTTVAEGNTPSYRARSENLINRDVSGVLLRFRDYAAQSSMSTNVEAWKVAVFEAAGEVVDSRRAFGLSGQNDDSFKAAQFGFLSPRESFEDQWDRGRESVYGVLNTGGLGALLFGDFCLVIGDPCSPAPDGLAVFPGDTAVKYQMVGGACDTVRAQGEAAAWADCGDLAVIERATEVLAAREEDWLLLICNDLEERYFEVVRIGSLPLQSVQEVRFAEAIEQFYARHYLGEKLLDTQLELVRAYQTALLWADRYELRLVSVA